MMWPFNLLRRRARRLAVPAPLRAIGPAIQQAEQEAARARLLAQARRRSTEYRNGGVGR
ncbi:hypothetical protein IW248_005203 [Micromonospora ureilytica]|uniref:Uncharacterized protein n=1 Tax=Micromonospora ureilytica TaxID=709868 RepID=A0ABS0JPD3_9ACTN|nr:hypothetical protein [Micromonospora ureilytica]